MNKTVVCILSLCISLVAIGYYAIDQHSQANKKAIAVKNEYNVDVQHCRILLHIDAYATAVTGDSMQALEMTCAHDTIKELTQKGVSMRDAASRAYKQCMPDYAACDRVLNDRSK